MAVMRCGVGPGNGPDPGRRPVRESGAATGAGSRAWFVRRAESHCTDVWHEPQASVYGMAIMSDALVGMLAFSGTSNTCDEMSPR